MKVGFLITEGGPHSPEKWAVATAEHIIQIAKDPQSEHAVAARKLEIAILDILALHHGLVQEHEVGKLVEHGCDRYEHPLDASDHCECPLQEIIDAAKGTPFEDHFARKEVQEHIHAILHQHFATSMHIERAWHAERAKGGSGSFV